MPIASRDRTQPNAFGRIRLFPGDTSLRIYHGMGRLDCAFYAILDYNSFVAITDATVDFVTVTFQVPVPTGGAYIYWWANATVPGTFGRTAVAATATTVTITHGAGSVSHRIVACPETPSTAWGSTIYVGAKTATTTVLNFSTPVPTGGGFVRWKVENDVANQVGSSTVSSGVLTRTVAHGRNRDDTLLFLTPNWPTTVWLDSRTPNQAIVNFGALAPASATLDWKTEIPYEQTYL